MANANCTLKKTSYPFIVEIRNTFIDVQIRPPMCSVSRRATSCPELSALLPTTAPVTQMDTADTKQQLTKHDAGSALDMPFSVGSLYHEKRGCKPCAFVRTDKGCLMAEACLFCHLCPPGEKGRRQKLKK